MASFIPIIGRILLSILFLVSGIFKIMTFSDSTAYVASVGIPFSTIALTIAIIIEIVGGIFLILGLFTRTIAIIMALFVLNTSLFFHLGWSIDDPTQLLQFLKNTSIIGGLLLLAYFGPGPMSIDKPIIRKSTFDSSNYKESEILEEIENNLPKKEI